MKKIIYETIGLDCPICATGMQGYIEKVPHVKKVKVDFFTQKVHLIVEDETNEEELFCQCQKATKSFNRTIKLNKLENIYAKL